MISPSLARDEVVRGGEASIAKVYSEDFARLSGFFTNAWQDIDSTIAYAKALESIGSFQHIDRSALVDTLIASMRPLGASKASLNHAHMLHDGDCFAVVTGQQACIAGGPLFVLAKVAHAIALAKELRQRGIKAVPIFWAASEDHDLEEANAFSYLNSKQKLKTLRIKSLASQAQKALEGVRLPDLDDQDVQAIGKTLLDGPNRAEAEQLFELGFGKKFGIAINRMLLKLFADDGLVVLEPRHLRRFAGFRRVVGMEIERPDLARGEIERANMRLREAGFDPALEPREYLNIFGLARGGKRRHLYFDGRAIDIVDEARLYASRGEALQVLAESPESFSTGVALRPVVQGACLPTLAYVGGPGEIAYHASLRGVFERCGVPMPCLIPRWSIALSEEPEQFEPTRNKVLEASRASKRAAASISESEVEIRAILRKQKDALGKLGTMLAKDFERLEGRASKALRELKGRTVANPLAAVQIDEQTRQRALSMLPSLIPQERALSWLALWPKYGGALREHFANRSAYDFSLRVIAP